MRLKFSVKRQRHSRTVDSGDSTNLRKRSGLKYRYLDLRREGPAKNLRLRSKVTASYSRRSCIELISWR
jgi:aspartyl-tRNA synthetase